MKIAICSSMHFLNDFLIIQSNLEKMGHTIFIPELGLEMKEEFGGGHTSIRGFFESQGGIEKFPFGHEIWQAKANAIRNHFEKIAQSDAILVTNFDKNGIAGYIGGNTFLEMGYAFAINKKIFVLNTLPYESSYKEEIYGLRPIVLNGNLDKLHVN